MVPQPVKAVILSHPPDEAILSRMREEDVKVKEEGQHEIDPGVIFIIQTVS